jgi:hypothetical protein
MFSARLIKQKDVAMLNICDSDILGKTVTRDKVTLKISENFYGKNTIEKEEAKDLLKKCNSINMVGKEIVSLSVNMGIGSQKGVKEIDGIPFLIVFKV